MRKAFFVFSAVFAALAAPTVARADVAADRANAIRACRAEVVEREGVTEERVRFDQVRVRPRVVRVDFDVWRNGGLQNIRCEVNRAGGPETATVTTPARPAVATR